MSRISHKDRPHPILFIPFILSGILNLTNAANASLRLRTTLFLPLVRFVAGIPWQSVGHCSGRVGVR